MDFILIIIYKALGKNNMQQIFVMFCNIICLADALQRRYEVIITATG